jgi:hypothetical protein
MNPKVRYAPALGDGSLGQRSAEVLAEVPNTPAPVFVPSAVLLATPRRKPTSRPIHAPGPCVQTRVPRKHASPKPRHVVLEKVSMAGRIHHEGYQALALTTPSSLQAPLATRLLDASWANRNSRRQPQSHYGAMHSLKATECKEPHTKSATNLAFQTYPSSQGHQVSFQEANGKWLAQAQDIWGRAQLLPVVCALDQTSTQAIQKLASKTPGQHKYWVHVLETNQTPWAPRVVYVGALGIRGGMKEEAEENTKMPSLSHVTTFTTPAAAQKAVEAYLERWRLVIPSGRAALREQGKDILRGVEVLKKKTKCSYRQQVLGFETCDIDPLVWHVVLQQQQTTKEQLNVLRGLRTQLLDLCQLQVGELQAAGMQMTINTEKGEVECYSSDEEAQQLSDQSRKNHAAFVAGIGKVLQGHTGALLAALVDDAMGTKIANHTTLLSSIPELPELLEDYVDEFLGETDEERSAELLGSLLTEVILLFVPLLKGKKSQLKEIKHKLGEAARRVISQRTNRLNTIARKGKDPKRISEVGQKK